MKEEYSTDIVVIGAGPGGYAAAFRAADLGADVILIDKDKELGGVCLNRGCIPSKALLHISKVMSDAAHLSDVGVTFQSPHIDIDLIRKYKERVVSQLNGGISQLAKARNVKVLNGIATYISNTKLSVRSETGKTTVKFNKCIIAAGSSSSMLPGIELGSKSILTSRTALELSDIPESLLVVGGGVIGMELGQVYASLGSEVSVVEFLPELISGADRDIIKPLERKLKNQFNSIMLSSKVSSISENKDGSVNVKINHSGETKVEKYSKVLISVGRHPNTESLNIKATDVQLDKRGYIVVDEYQKTSAENILAIGDITGNPMLAHKATYEGKVAAEVACGHPAVMDALVIPSVVYTDPEVAWVGLTENQAREDNIKYEKGDFPWAASGKAHILNTPQGKTKILFNPENKKVLGAGIVGTAAGDLISEACLAIEMGADVEDIALTIHPHPTLGETFAAASEMYSGTITDLYIPKKRGS